MCNQSNPLLFLLRKTLFRMRRMALQAVSVLIPLAVLLTCITCLACGSKDGTPDASNSDVVEEIVTGVQDVACAADPVSMAPVTVPTCAAATFQVEFPSRAEYPNDRVLPLADGRTLVAQVGAADGVDGQVRLALLSAKGVEETSAIIEPCDVGVSVEVSDLQNGLGGEFLLVVACSPWTSEQQFLLVRVNPGLAIADGQEQAIVETQLLFNGPGLPFNSVSLAYLNDTLYALAVERSGDGDSGQEVSTVILLKGVGSNLAVRVELVTAQTVSTGPLVAANGHLLVLLSEVTQAQKGDTYSEVLVMDASGTVLKKLCASRYVAGDLDFRPSIVRSWGEDMVIAGESWDMGLGVDRMASLDVVVQHRKLDGTLVRQVRLPFGPRVGIVDVVPLALPTADSSIAGLILSLYGAKYMLNDESGIEVHWVPQFTWLTTALEPRFGTLQPEAIPQVPISITPGCDGGYRVAWDDQDSLHVVRTNNLLRYGVVDPCDDSWMCTSDAQEDGVCTLEVTSGCLAPEGCYDVGDFLNNDPCMVCGQKADCTSYWQPLLPNAGCGIEGTCQDGRCVCKGRWVVAMGSSLDMREVLGAGRQQSGHVVALTLARQLKTWNQSVAHVIDISPEGEAVDHGPLPDSWSDLWPVLSAPDALYVVTHTANSLDETLRSLDAEGNAKWSLPLPPWPSLSPQQTVGLVQGKDGNVLAYNVFAEDQKLHVAAVVASADGQTLGAGDWEKSFEQLKGDAKFGDSDFGSRERAFKASVLPDGRFLILAQAIVVSGDLGIGHVFIIVVDSDAGAATLGILPTEAFEGDMAIGTDGFLSCRGMMLDQRTLDGVLVGSLNIGNQIQMRDDIVRTCLDLAVGADGQIQMLVHVQDKTSHTEGGEVLLLDADWKLEKTVSTSVIPAESGLTGLPDGGFLVRGTLDSGIAALLRADARGNFRCW